MFETWNRSYVSSFVKNKRRSRLTGDSLQSCGTMNVTLYSPDVQTQVQEHSTFLSYNLPLILSLVFTKLLTYSLDLLDFFCFLIYHATLSLWIFLTVIFFICTFCKFRSRFCYTLRKPKVVSCHSYKFKVWKRPRVQNVFITWIS